MKSSAFIPFVVVMAAYSAQAAESSYQKDPTEPPVSHFQGSCESDPDGTTRANKVLGKITSLQLAKKSRSANVKRKSWRRYTAGRPTTCRRSSAD